MILLKQCALDHALPVKKNDDRESSHKKQRADKRVFIKEDLQFFRKKKNDRKRKKMLVQKRIRSGCNMPVSSA